MSIRRDEGQGQRSSSSQVTQISL